MAPPQVPVRPLGKPQGHSLGTPQVRPRLCRPKHPQPLERSGNNGRFYSLAHGQGLTGEGAQTVTKLRGQLHSSKSRGQLNSIKCNGHWHCLGQGHVSFPEEEPSSARQQLLGSFPSHRQPGNMAQPGRSRGRSGGGGAGWGMRPCRAHHEGQATGQEKVKGEGEEGEGEGGGSVLGVLGVLTSLYPVYVALGGALGVWQPGVYQWFLAGAPGSLSLALGVIMGVMGLTLRVDQLLEVLLARPQAVAFGCFCQYFLMPLSGLCVARLFSLPTDLAAGLLLLSCCPGGTASNVVTFIARGDVPLSVIMTLVSTLLAALATPLLTQLLIGATVPVDLLGLARSTLQVVLLPVLLGAGLNTVFPAAAQRVAPFCPLVAVLVSSLLASSVFSSTLSTFLTTRAAQSAVASGAASAGPGAPTGLLAVAAAVVTVHFIGFLLGYWVSKAAGYTEEQRRAISIEVGMQNSSLGVVLALQHLPSPNSALPAALSAIIMNVMGSTLGAAWGIFGSREKAQKDEMT